MPWEKFATSLRAHLNNLYKERLFLIFMATAGVLEMRVDKSPESIFGGDVELVDSREYGNLAEETYWEYDTMPLNRYNGDIDLMND